MENRIKEQQLDLFATRTSAHWMGINQLRLWFSSLVYTLVAELRRLGLEARAQARARSQTLRLKLFKIGARVRGTRCKIWVFLSSACPHQELFAPVYDRRLTPRAVRGSIGPLRWGVPQNRSQAPKPASLTRLRQPRTSFAPPRSHSSPPVAPGSRPRPKNHGNEQPGEKSGLRSTQEAAVKNWMVISVRRQQSADNQPIVLGRMKAILVGIVAAVIVTTILAVLLILGSVVAILVGILLVIGIGLAIIRAALRGPSR